MELAIGSSFNDAGAVQATDRTIKVRARRDIREHCRAEHVCCGLCGNHANGKTENKRNREYFSQFHKSMLGTEKRPHNYM
jgi:hypothetical protein